MSKMPDKQRNLNPHAEAIAAMYIWGREYSQQHGGSMDFWDSLAEWQKRVCIELVQKIRKAQSA